MMLIIASQSPFSNPLPNTETNAALVLTQDSVIAVTTSIESHHFVKVYALESDLIARGLLQIAQQHPTISIISLAQFVELTVDSHPLMNW